MFVLFVLLIFLLTTGHAIHQFNLGCPHYDYMIVEEEPKLKKTKAWKKCDASNDELLECIGKGYKAERETLVDETVILCKYVRSETYNSKYQLDFEEGKQSTMDKWKDGKALQEYLDTSKEEFVEHEVLRRNLEELSTLTDHWERKLEETHDSEKTKLLVLLVEIQELAKDYKEQTRNKRANIMTQYEDFELGKLWGQVLHGHLKTTGYMAPWTTMPWSNMPTSWPAFENVYSSNYYVYKHEVETMYGGLNFRDTETDDFVIIEAGNYMTPAMPKWWG